MRSTALASFLGGRVVADHDWSVAVYQQRSGNYFTAQLRSTIGAAGLAVNVGGFWPAAGLSGNLIALRMAWRSSHLVALPSLLLPMLLWAALVGYGLLQRLIFRELGKKRTETPHHSRSPFPGITLHGSESPWIEGESYALSKN